MNKVDTNHIKEMTNQMIGYENFKMEEEMKTKKMKKVMFLFGVLFLLGIGTVTANALTNNKIVDMVKDVSIKVISGNVKEIKNGVCKKLENGNYSCTFKDPSDGEEEITMEYSLDDTNNKDISIQYNYVDK